MLVLVHFHKNPISHLILTESLLNFDLQAAKRRRQYQEAKVWRTPATVASDMMIL